MGIPVVIALNMMDIVKKRGDVIDVKKLSQELGVPVVETAAIKGEGTKELVEAATVSYTHLDVYKRQEVPCHSAHRGFIPGERNDKALLPFHDLGMDVRGSLLRLSLIHI